MFLALPALSLFSAGAGNDDLFASESLFFPSYESQQSVDSSAEVEQAAVQLVSSLPEETLCKVLANREVGDTSSKVCWYVFDSY